MAPTSVGVLSLARHDAVGDVDLAVPPATAVPAISYQQAYAECALGDPVCVMGSAPTITLALAFAPHSGHANADGSITPVLNNTLVYMLAWHNVPCPIGGPAGASNPPTSARNCSTVNFIDASTGESLYGYTG